MNLYQQIFFTTLALAFSLLHFFLYYYNRRKKSNLLFAFFLVFYAANIFFDYQSALSNGVNELYYLRWHRAVMPLNTIFSALFLYSFFALKIPKYFWAIVTLIFFATLFAIYDPEQNFIYLLISAYLIIPEMLRIFIIALTQNKDGVRVTAAGFGFLLLFSMYDMVLDLGIMDPIYGITNGYPFGFLALLITISMYLARDYARINEKIIHQEVEDRRKSQELKEARKLQLSLLPDCNFEINNLDICFDMHTATEVGGDYYDYYLEQDKAITIAIGDATGHGTKAGIMVSIIKSLFLTHVKTLDFISFFNRCSETIKKMNLGNLYMAMMLVKIENKKLTASAAGIPAILIYRNKKHTIEEITIKGMPLGAFNSFPYQTIETELQTGDVVLLMTDGLAEQFNEQKEEFDYDRIKHVFLEYSHLSPDEMVQQLFKAGELWRKHHQQNDDITLVAIKQK